MQGKKTCLPLLKVKNIKIIKIEIYIILLYPLNFRKTMSIFIIIGKKTQVNTIHQHAYFHGMSSKCHIGINLEL